MNKILKNNRKSFGENGVYKSIDLRRRMKGKFHFVVLDYIDL